MFTDDTAILLSGREQQTNQECIQHILTLYNEKCGSQPLRVCKLGGFFELVGGLIKIILFCETETHTLKCS